MILVFQLRSILNTTKLDRFNADAWREIIEPFGFYVDEKFYEEVLVHQSEQEIHSDLLPITPYNDYQSMQRTRHKTLESCVDVARPLEGCNTPFPLLPGVAEFLKTLSSAGEGRVFKYLLTNLPVDLVRQVLDRSEEGLSIGDYFDGILQYTAEAQSRRSLVSNIRKGTSGESTALKLDESQCPPKDAHIFSFENSVRGVKLALKAEMKPIGVAMARSIAKDLNDAGASYTIDNYSNLKAEYLPMMAK